MATARSGGPGILQLDLHAFGPVNKDLAEIGVGNIVIFIAIAARLDALQRRPEFVKAEGDMPQGVSADLIATKYGFSRTDVDAYAVESQKRAAYAWEQGWFDKSVIPVKDQNGLTILDKDEHMPISSPNTPGGMPSSRMA